MRKYERDEMTDREKYSACKSGSCECQTVAAGTLTTGIASRDRAAKSCLITPEQSAVHSLSHSTSTSALANERVPVFVRGKD